ncbi:MULTISPECIES: LysR family transcriptional regulator [Pseudomonas]|jgi:DNA-binding transcriptional LysR family regulator|uniref:LysR family transcriptional regulator n=1 Tax=Pseudomonas TaxID=286 RepID=UPI0002DA80FE|nr:MULTISPECIES: LysR family transcriptional regulator [Pseudomonas]MCU1775043.1 LysR family transcriptional regulator [Pseudomonas sp. 13B_3.2_Bac1]RBC01457.1 LysR family transcriptional regulator [Pseudomonas sp. MWU12-2115]RBL72770.1 LysR family transcriptional regulator [Pseudomonas sp. MWU13-2625]
MERADTSFPDIAAFVGVAQTGSFTRAAENLATSKSNVGKAVQRLESRLGTKLFQRTTRAVRLTEDGETYLLAAQAALDGLRDAAQALAARKEEPIGRVRLDIPSGFRQLFLPTLSELRHRYPQVTLELSMTDRMSDAVGEGWDIVVRAGVLPQDSEMTVRKLCNTTLSLYASPDYLARHAPIETAADLVHHDAVIFRGFTGKLRPWSLTENGHFRELAPPPVLVLSDGQAMIDATVVGLGISQLFNQVAQPYVDCGRLVPVLPALDSPGPPVHALIPLGNRMPAKTRAVLNYLADRLR